MMVRLLAITLMLGAAHAAFGHDPISDPDFAVAFQFCADTGGLSSGPHLEDCAHLCGDVSPGQQGLTGCLNWYVPAPGEGLYCPLPPGAAFPGCIPLPASCIEGSDPTTDPECFPWLEPAGPVCDPLIEDCAVGPIIGNGMGNFSPNIIAPIDNSIFSPSVSPIDNSIFSPTLNPTAVGGAVRQSGNSTVGPSGNVGNGVGNLSPIADAYSEVDVGDGRNSFSPDGGDVDIADSGNATINDNSSIRDNSTQNITDGDTELCSGRDSCDQEINDSGNSTVDSHDDNRVTLDSNDDNRVTDNSEQTITDGDTTVELHSHDDNTNENENESKSTSSTEESGNSDVNIDQSDNSTVSNTSVYKEAYRAPNLSTQLNVTTSHCINFIGLQFSGARQSGSTAFGLGWPARDEECRLEKAAMLAFQMENYEAGWTAYCHQKSVRHAWANRMKAEGHTDKGRKAAASIACRQSGVDTQQTLRNIHEELEMLRKEMVILEDMEADTETVQARITVLEDVAHLPNETFLLRESP